MERRKQDSVCFPAEASNASCWHHCLNHAPSYTFLSAAAPNPSPATTVVFYLFVTMMVDQADCYGREGERTQMQGKVKSVLMKSGWPKMEL